MARPDPEPRRSQRNEPDVVSRLGLARIVNAAGTMTSIGASRVVPEAIAAGAEIQGHFVRMDELQAKASAVIARLTGAEAGCITACSAGGDDRLGRRGDDRSRPREDRAVAGHCRHEERGRGPGRAPDRLRSTGRAGGAGVGGEGCSGRYGGARRAVPPGESPRRLGRRRSLRGPRITRFRRGRSRSTTSLPPVANAPCR